ncbi:MAG: D-alanyl-D-alanine carboxypeptidase [Schwartzia sp.]|nr:D-alanyl-D-alanine carboxypeptidase [Schwartzia sp. (in: firmicutes)]
MISTKKSLILSLFFCCLLVPRLAFAALSPSISAESAIVIEASTGRVIYEKNPDRLMHPASMTKIMTCLLALERTKMDDVVVIDEEAAGTDYAYLSKGNVITMGELLTEMMLESDNGAAVAVAEQMAPSVGDFAEMMTERAHQIGAMHTRFANPNGLTQARHYSTARDMASIAREAWQIPGFQKIVGQKTHQVKFVNNMGDAWMAENLNNLLWTYKGMVGIKTGYTDAAGGCLAGAATRDGVTLISVVMNSEGVPERFNETAKLLDYSFPQVKLVKGPKREKLGRTVWVFDGSTYKVSAHPASDVKYLLFPGEDKKKYSYAFDMPRFIYAPVQKGDKVGELVLLYDGKEAGRIDMIADSSMEKGFSLVAHVIGFYDKILGPFLA